MFSYSFASAPPTRVTAPVGSMVSGGENPARQRRLRLWVREILPAWVVPGLPHFPFDRAKEKTWKGLLSPGRPFTGSEREQESSACSARRDGSGVWPATTVASAAAGAKPAGGGDPGWGSAVDEAGGAGSSGGLRSSRWRSAGVRSPGRDRFVASEPDGLHQGLAKVSDDGGLFGFELSRAVATRVRASPRLRPAAET